MSIKLNPKVTVGSMWGQRDWVSFVGGQWAGRWGKGVVLVGSPVFVSSPHICNGILH